MKGPPPSRDRLAPAYPAVVEEAMTRYLGWEVYNHDKGGAQTSTAKKG